MNAIKKIVMGLAVASAAVFCSAADYYVATPEKGGDDGNAGTSSAPFAKIATGIAAAKAAGGGTVRVGAGTYEENSLVLDAAITVISDDEDRSKVTVFNNYWTSSKAKYTFQLTADGAALRHLTIKGPWTSARGNQNQAEISGQCVRMTADGEVTDCEILNGVSGTSKTTGSGQGGNVWMSAGRLARCYIHHGNGGFGGYNYAPNVYAEGASVIENCLMANGGAPGNASKKASVYLAGTSKMINCTVVKSSYGVVCDATTAQVLNTIIYGNGGAAATEWGNANGGCFVNCAFAAGLAPAKGTDCIDTVTKADFRNIDSDVNCRLTPKSLCVDAGAEEYPADCSGTDLDGSPRKSGVRVDIGCYELDLDEVSPFGEVSCDCALLGSSLEFTASAIGGEGAYTYKWDFGDGREAFETTEATVNYTYAAPGLYEVTVTAKAGAGGYVTPYVLPVNICIARKDLYVATNGDNANSGEEGSPFKTIAKALSCLTNNMSGGKTVVDGVTIHLFAGTYTENSLVLSSAITVVSKDEDRSTVTVYNSDWSKYTFQLTAAGAALRHLTIRGSYVGSNQNGATVNGQCVRMTAAGEVTDCEIFNGVGGHSCKGGNVYANAGRIARCYIHHGYGRHGGSCYGDNVFAEGTALVENCLITDGYEGGNNTANAQTYLLGSAKLVNCTIVKNPSGKCGVYCAAATAQVLNTIIYGNGGAAATEWGNANGECFVNCAFAAGLAPAKGTDCIDTVTEEDAFVGYADGDYMPTAGSVLLKAGTTWAKYLECGATSTTDLAGKPRRVGKKLDIGCYVPKPGGLLLILR